MMRVILKPGREKSLLRRHPWIFSGAIQSVEGDPQPGEVVAVIASDGVFLGRGAFSSQSSIRVRMWTFYDELVNDDFLRARLRAALEFRQWQPNSHAEESAQRLVFGESDGLPGLIVDQYAGQVVIQVLSAGVEAWRQELSGMLVELTGIHNIYERSDVDVRELEGLAPRKRVLLGSEPPTRVEIREHGLRFGVDVRGGQKTGFYLDQADNRLKIRRYAANLRVLNAFAYTGGFTVNALAGGASEVLSIESSRAALEEARTHLAANGQDATRTEWACADVFSELRRLRDAGRQFDMVILDPPKFAPTNAQVHAAARGYKDINMLAIKLLAPGGLLVTFSCSGGVSRALFHKIIADAALDAGSELGVLEVLSQSCDHPVALHFPESEYLKGLICRKRA